MTLVYLCIAWLAGIAVGRAAQGSWWLWLGLAALALIAFVLSPKAGKEWLTRFSWRTAFGCALFFSLGAARIGIALPHFDEHDLATYNDRGFVTLEGVIVAAPDVRDTHVNLRVQVESLTLPEGEERPVRGVALVQAPLLREYRYGDPVRVHGELHTPPEFEGFSYRDYLARQRIYSLIRYAQVDVTGERRGNPVRRLLLDFRDQAYSVINRLLSEPQASLLAGILLGIESGISPDLREAFNATGAAHVIAISGSNLAILAGVIQNVTRRFMKEHLSSLLTIAGVLVYALFVGGDPAVIRAAIMVTLGLVAARLGRQTWGFTSLAFAALLMTAINPYTLWDASFQLSFLATLGLILYVEPLQILLEKGLSALLAAETARRIVGALSDAFVVTVAAQITTTPVMAYLFRQFSLVSLPVNFLIIPLQTPLMVLGGLAVLSALIVWPVGQVLAWGSWLFLSLTIWVVRLFARLPFASLDVENLSVVAVWGIYGVMFGLTFLAMQSDEQRTRRAEWLRQAFGTKLLAGAGLVVAALLFVGAGSLPDGKLHITFVDAGSGTVTLIRTPGGRYILVGAEGSPRRILAALGDALPFWERRLDLVILTRPLSSRSGALLPVLERYQVGALVTDGSQGEGQLAAGLWTAIEAEGAAQVVAQPGMRISVGDDVTLTVLHASVGEPLALMLAYGEAHFLLAGDLPPEGEASLLNSGFPLNATVLEVPAGGSGDAASEAFLAAVTPQIGVLALGSSDRVIPDPQTLDRLEATGALLYRTDEQGTLEFVSDGQRLWIRGGP